MPLTGTILNVLAILIGCAYGLLAPRQPAQASQLAIKILLGAFATWMGLSLTWQSLHGTFLQCLGQFGIAVLSLTLGHATGKLLRLQHHQRIGRFATERVQKADRPGTQPARDGFVTCTILFCASPIALLGASLDGLGGSWEVLAIKAVMDGFSCVAFVSLFGPVVLLAAIPVLAFQGTIALLSQALGSWLGSSMYVDAFTAAGGMVVFCIALVILELKKVALADYLPSLIYGPLLTWAMRG